MAIIGGFFLVYLFYFTYLSVWKVHVICLSIKLVCLDNLESVKRGKGMTFDGLK